VTLASALTDRLPRAAGAAGNGATGPIPDAVRDRIAPLMADAYGHTFWIAVGLLVLAFAGAILLPRTKPEAPADEAETASDAPEAAVLAHV
jgi:hypothetical protein